MDSIFKVLLGVELSTLVGLEESKAFSKAIDEASTQTLYRIFDLSWKVKKFLNVGSEALMKKNVKLIKDFIDNVINKRIEQISTQKGDFVSHVYELQVNYYAVYVFAYQKYTLFTFVFEYARFLFFSFFILCL
jgi:hypothetical protein